MTLVQLYKKLRIFTNPYKSLIFYTLLLTLIGSFAAQVNAFILKYTVDSINDLMVAKRPLQEGFYILGMISIMQTKREFW